jgi:hypothetical protein
MSSKSLKSAEVLYNSKKEYWVDSNGNHAYKHKYKTEENAIRALMSLVGCDNCNSCTDCTNCISCTDCISCVNCYNCENCFNCNNCTDCINCYNCADCNALKDRNSVKSNLISGLQRNKNQTG